MQGGGTQGGGTQGGGMQAKDERQHLRWMDEIRNKTNTF